MKHKNFFIRLTAAMLALTLVSGAAISTTVFASNNETEIISDDGYAVYGNYKYYYAKDKTIALHKYTGSESTLTIPETIKNTSVTAIDANAFANKVSLKNITIPKTVTSIDDSCGIGFYENTAVSGFVIYGYTDSAAQTYAKNKGLTFVALDAPLTNNSSVSAGSVKAGEKVTLTASAKGGSGEYTYAFLYKLSSAASWITIGTKYGTASTSAITFKKGGTYDILISIKDSDGKTAVKRFSVNVEEIPALENTSSISAAEVRTGTKITLTGSSTGGNAPCGYTYQYQKPDKTSWITIGEKYGTASSATFTPKIDGIFKARILVKDASGTTKTSLFTINVTGKLLENNSSVSATSVKTGSSLTLTASAVDGTAPYYYTYESKTPDSDKWSSIGKRNTTSTTAKFTPSAAGSYDLRVLIKDATGFVTSKTFQVTAN